MSHREGARRRSARRALTMVELPMVLSIAFLVVAGVVLTLTKMSTQAWDRSDIQMANAAVAQQALNRVEADLHRASRATLRCVTLSVPMLIFGPVDGTGTVSYYRHPGTNTLRRTQGTTTQIMAGGITEFQPVCTSSIPLAQISLTTRNGKTSTRGKASNSTQTFLATIKVPNP